MKSLNFLILSLLLLLLNTSCVRIDELKDAQQKIRQTLNEFYRAQEENDLQKISSLYDKISSPILLGTGKEAHYVGWENIRDAWQEQFQQAGSMKTFRSNETIEVSESLKTGWVSSVNKVEMTVDGKVVSNTIFFSAVLEKRAQLWLLVQTHFSMPGANEAGIMSTAAKILPMKQQLKEKSNKEAPVNQKQVETKIKDEKADSTVTPKNTEKAQDYL